MNITIYQQSDQNKHFVISYTGSEWKLFIENYQEIQLPSMLEYNLSLSQNEIDIEIPFRNVSHSSPHYPWVLLIQIMSGDLPEFLIGRDQIGHAALLLEDFFTNKAAEIIRTSQAQLNPNDAVEFIPL